jgi:ribosomal protein S18 acetylase RimI-like enzyme
MIIRPALPQDHAAIWSILEPVIRAGETYALPRDMGRAAALAYWTNPDRETFVAELRDCSKSRSGESAGRDFRASARSVRQYVSTGAQKVATRRPPERLLEQSLNGEILGTYYLRPNQTGGGAHVANCGYVTAQNATGRGIARAMAEHSLGYAKSLGFTAMQFNFVISTNTSAIHLWESLGFTTLCRLPGTFHHPNQGFVDALVMFRTL